MKNSSPGKRTNWAGRLAGSAAVGIFLGLAGVGGFAWSCQRQSETYDLSALSNQPGRVRLADIPQSIVEAAARQDDLIPSQVLAEEEFGLHGNSLRTRVVRGMVAALIEQKFSQREVAEFYFNRVAPGAARLRRMVRHQRVEPIVTPVSFVAQASPAAPVEASVPPEMTPLPPAQEAPMLVRRAVPVEKPVRRALPAASLPPDAPVRRALPPSNLARLQISALDQLDGPVARALPVASTTISPGVICRVAVVDR